jgi:DNA-binding CsgD family transcriptional regulator
MYDLTHFDILETPIPEIGSIATRADAVDSLRRFATHFDLANATFLSVEQVDVGRTDIEFATTYDTGWVNRYTERRYQDIDPVVRLTRNRLLPLDWSSIEINHPSEQRFFDEAVEYGVGRNGVSVPIRGPNREASVFSATVDLTGADWRAIRRNLVSVVQVFGYEFQKTLLESAPPAPDEVRARLSRREIETLRWASEGKTAWETAIILGISPLTVKQYLASAISKLDSVNKIHAVAKAVRMNII